MESQQSVPSINRWFLIINPKAGNGRALLDFPHISKLLHDQAIFCDPHFTEHKSQAVEYTVTAVNKGYRKIIVIGGDGTLHEVVNGLFIQQQVAPQEITLGVIGVGIGNDWLRTFGFEEHKYADMISAIKEGRSMLQDVGAVSYVEAHYKQVRYMVGAGGAGFIADVVKRFSHRSMKRKRNKWSLIWCIIKSFFRYKHPGVKIYLDDRLIYNDLLFSTTIGIGKFSSGGLQQLPDALIDDGMLDISIVRPIHFWHILFRIKYLFDGNIHKIGHIERWRGERIRIESIPEIGVEVDGEILGGTPLEFSTIPKTIQIIVSSNFLENRQKHSSNLF